MKMYAFDITLISFHATSSIQSVDDTRQYIEIG